MSTNMLKGRVYHVIRCEDDSWKVIKEGFKRPHIIQQTKEEAILFAKRLAKLMPDSKVVIHADGDFQDGEHRSVPHVAERS